MSRHPTLVYLYFESWPPLCPDSCSTDGHETCASPLAPPAALAAALNAALSPAPLTAPTFAATTGNASLRQRHM